MGEKTPNIDRSGIERRDVLKGLGFGMVGAAGIASLSDGATAAGNIVNVGITLPGEDLEDDEVIPKTDNRGHEHLPGTPDEADTPTLDPNVTDGTYDLVVEAQMGRPDSTLLIGKTLTILSVGRGSTPSLQGNNTTNGPNLRTSGSVFEEGTAKSSTEDVMTDTDGVAEIRQRFSVENLPAGEYIVTLACIDYSTLGTASPRRGNENRFLEGTYPFDVEPNVTVVPHGFNVGRGANCRPVQHDIVLVLDQSGSMENDRKLQRAKAGGSRLVDQLASNDRVGLVSFADTATLRSPLTQDFTEVKSQLTGLSIGGGTNLAAGISRGQSELDANGRTDSEKIMIVLADGQHNTGGGDPIAVASDAKSADTRIIAIAVPPTTGDQLNRMASDPENFYRVERPEEVEAVFDTIVQEICQ